MVDREHYDLSNRLISVDERGIVFDVEERMIRARRFIIDVEGINLDYNNDNSIGTKKFLLTIGAGLGIGILLYSFLNYTGL